MSSVCMPTPLPGLHHRRGSGAACPRGSGSAPRARRSGSRSRRSGRRPSSSAASARPPPRATRRAWSGSAPCCSAGKTSMMRSIVLGALEVCSVPKTRCPVSAAVSASEIVSRSRISPTRITSGSSRSALRSAFVEGVRVRPDLALVHEAALRRVDELDRVLDREDVGVPGLVDEVDHGGERRRLARARRPGDEDEAALAVAELLHDGRHVERVERGDHRGNRPQDRAGAAALHEDVHAEAALARAARRRSPPRGPSRRPSSARRS